MSGRQGTSILLSNLEDIVIVMFLELKSVDHGLSRLWPQPFWSVSEASSKSSDKKKLCEETAMSGIIRLTSLFCQILSN